MAALRRHRAGRGVLSPLVLPSMLFPVAPWVWPSAIGLAVGLIVHACWLALCETLAPPRLPRSNESSTTGRQPRPSSESSRSAPSAPPMRTDSIGSGKQPFATTSVLAVLDEAADIKTFRLSRPAEFEFAAGQFVPVRIQVEGKPHVRCYSISSSPDTRGYFEISVRRQGLVSTMLHASLGTGAPVAVGRPAGTFVYPARDDRPIALVAGGIGITPLLSMLRYAVSSDPARPITLLYSVRSERHLAFLSELRIFAERHPEVKVAITLTRPTTPGPWRTGRIDEAMLRQHVPHPAHSIFCLCGPGQMIAETTRVLQEMGVPESQIRSEQFDLAVAATVLSPTGVGVATFSAQRQTSPDECRQVTFAASRCTRLAPVTQTLLETAEAGGIPLASSCRAGVCQACRTRLVDGEVDCRSDVLDPGDRAAGYILPCVSWATTDCVIEA